MRLFLKLFYLFLVKPVEDLLDSAPYSIDVTPWLSVISFMSMSGARAAGWGFAGRN